MSAQLRSSDGAQSVPLGIKLLCSAAVFVLIGTLLAALFGIGPSLAATQGGVSSVLGVITAVLIVSALYGLWTGQWWGWLLAVVYAGVNVVMYGGFMTVELTTVLVWGAIAVYLLSQRRHYRRTTPTAT